MKNTRTYVATAALPFLNLQLLLYHPLQSIHNLMDLPLHVDKLSRCRSIGLRRERWHCGCRTGCDALQQSWCRCSCSVNINSMTASAAASASVCAAPALLHSSNARCLARHAGIKTVFGSGRSRLAAQLNCAAAHVLSEDTMISLRVSASSAKAWLAADDNCRACTAARTLF